MNGILGKIWGSIQHHYLDKICVVVFWKEVAKGWLFYTTIGVLQSNDPRWSNIQFFTFLFEGKNQRNLLMLILEEL